jgi:hypothetical protein
MCCFLFKRKWVSVESSHADKVDFIDGKTLVLFG